MARLFRSAVGVGIWCVLGLFLAVESQSDSCASDLSTFLPAPFNASGLSCNQVWNDFVLRYSQNQDNVLSIILSATYTSGWIGIGFSKDGGMVGSSAMIGWIGRDMKGHVRPYYLGGHVSSKVVVNEGELRGVSNRTKAIVVYGPNLYIAFQWKLPAPATQQPLLFAFGTKIPTKYVLTKHQDKTSIIFDFSSGSTGTTPVSAFSYPYQLKRNHGILAIVGWGVLLPIGALVSRYCKQWDPLWHYLHVAIQFVGFIIGLAAVVAGIALYGKLHVDIKIHRGIGIFVLVLGILQVLAFFVHPNKDSKYRRYWNWYHHWFGRLTLLFAALNVALGIQAGNAGQPWKVGYGVNLAIILIATVVLETMSWLRSPKKAAPPSF